MMTPNEFCALPMTVVASLPTSFCDWRQRRPKEHHPVNYVQVPAAVHMDRPKPKPFVKTYRRHGEHVMHIAPALDTLNDAAFDSDGQQAAPPAEPPTQRAIVCPSKRRCCTPEHVVCRLDILGAPQPDIELCVAVVEPPMAQSGPVSPGTEEVQGPKLPPATPPRVPLSSVVRRRAGQRWSALLSAPTSRIARTMRSTLGEEHWAAFVSHVTQHYKRAFFAAFQPASGTLNCVGNRGQPCPHGFCIDLHSPTAGAMLYRLHLDHEQDLQITCDMWRSALPASPTSWDDGVDGRLLCHLLLGVEDDEVHGGAMLRFRCGPALDGNQRYCVWSLNH